MADIEKSNPLMLERVANGFKVEARGNCEIWVATTPEQLVALVAEWAGISAGKVRFVDQADSESDYIRAFKRAGA